MSARSGSDNRQRQQKISTRLTPEELRQIQANATAQGMTVAQLLRTRALTPA